MKNIALKIFFILIITATLLGMVNSQMALLLGLVFTLIFDKPLKGYDHKIIHSFLKLSLIGLGFGLFIKETFETSRESFGLIFFSIILTISLGLLLIKLLKVDSKLGYLITTGTAICGGSAIAAISPIIKASSKVISISIGVIFLLNSIAIFVFPAIGHALNLSQKEFGLWAAIAIHDTSSVVGAALVYGEEALRIATTVKLSRTLWIIPLSIFSIFYHQNKGAKIKIPFFILLFVTAIFTNNYQILPVEVTSIIVLGSKRLLVATLFLIGTTISIADFKSTGPKPILLALGLWIFISIFSLIYITY